MNGQRVIKWIRTLGIGLIYVMIWTGWILSMGNAIGARLEDERVRLIWDKRGGIVSVTDKDMGAEMIASAEYIAQGFSLLLRQEDGSVQTVWAKDQDPPVMEISGPECRFVWSGPLKEGLDNSFDIDVTARYRLHGSTVSIILEVVNRSDVMVAEVRYPQIAGISKFRPHDNSIAARLRPLPSTHAEIPVEIPFSPYVNQYPGWMNMAFMTVVHEEMKQGFYLGAHDEIPRLKQWRFEEVTKQGVTDIAAWIVHHPHLRPGQRFTGCGCTLAFFEGDWIQGGQIYRSWFLQTWGLRSREEDWIRKKHFYQMIMMMLPEGNINYRFEDVPELARQGLEYGIDSLQLAGWQRGGHDNGYPYYEPDSRLGNWDDVAQAIRECHAMGVKVYFFVNIHTAMMDIEWYKNELHRYVSINVLDEINWIAAWGMGTVGSRLDRAYAPNTTVFTPIILDGREYRGEQVYIEAVDNAPEQWFSMLCIDHVQTVAIEPDQIGKRWTHLNPDRHLRLENDFILVLVDNEYGRICRIQDKKSEIDLISEPRLADNFAFTLPIVGKEAWSNTEANFIHGMSQFLSEYTLERNRLTLRWDGPLASVFGVFHDVSAEISMALDGESIQFEMSLHNRTNLEIGEVYYPIIAGTLGLGRNDSERRNTFRSLPVGDGIDIQKIYQTFNNMTPFGELYPEQLYAYPHTLSMPWMHLYAPRQDRGLYLGAHDSVRRVKMVQFLHKPGVASNRADGNWPRPEELDGDPMGVSFNFVHVAY